MIGMTAKNLSWQRIDCPRPSDEEKSRLGEAIQTTLRAATKTPLACARACAQVVALSRRAGEKGYVGVVGDAGVGVMAANAAQRRAQCLHQCAFAQRSRLC